MLFCDTMLCLGFINFKWSFAIPCYVLDSYKLYLECISDANQSVGTGDCGDHCSYLVHRCILPGHLLPQLGCMFIYFGLSIFYFQLDNSNTILYEVLFGLFLDILRNISSDFFLSMWEIVCHVHFNTCNQKGHLHATPTKINGTIFLFTPTSSSQSLR